jgi:hypothetical protein
MRDPARIEPILEAIRRVWAQNPDLRLAQLLVNVIRPTEPCPQVFHCEDSALLGQLKNWAEGGRPPADQDAVTITLSREEAIVLTDWLDRFIQQDKLSIQDPAEAQALWNLECLLEKVLVEPFLADWDKIVAAARTALRPAAE